MAKKLVVVTMATGKQGGSLVNALLAHGGYDVRALTRNVDAPAGQALAAKGASVVYGHPGDKESLLKAFEGAYAVFGVSLPAGFQQVENSVSELEQGHNLVDACKAHNVPLLVWSSLPSVTESSNGKYTSVEAFDQKADVDKYIKAEGQPAVIFKTGGFTSNLIDFGSLKRDAQDPSKWHIYQPFVRATVRTLATYVEPDLGPAVLAAIEHWDDPAWRAELEKAPIPLCSYRITGEEKVETIRRVTGKDVDYVCIRPEGMHVQLKEMNQWIDEGFHTHAGAIPPDILVRLGVKFHSFEDYVRERVAPFMDAQK